MQNLFLEEIKTPLPVTLWSTAIGGLCKLALLNQSSLKSFNRITLFYNAQHHWLPIPISLIPF